MKITQGLPKKLQDLRKNMGLSQEQLAKKVGLSRPTITLIEQGKRKLSVEDMMKFCQALECKYEDLLSTNATNKNVSDSQKANIKELYDTYKDKYQKPGDQKFSSRNPLDEYLREADPYYYPSTNYQIRYEQ